MRNSKPCGFRAASRLIRLIDAARGEASFSTWVREACARRLEAEIGLGPEIRLELDAHLSQLRGLGTNLNQLARAANERRPVLVNNELLNQVLREIRASREVIADLHRRLIE